MDHRDQTEGTEQEPPPAPADEAATIRPEPTDPEPPHGDPLRTGEDASRHGADADGTA